MLACDYAWDRPSAQSLRDNGIGGVLRYADYPGAQGKGMSRGEYEALLADGFLVGWVMETFGQAAGRGYDQGIQEARQAFAWADSIGWPRDRPGYFCAEDPNVQPRSAWPAIADYFRGVHDADPGRPVPGAYGSPALCHHLAELGLVDNEWHVSTWPGDLGTAALIQEANGIPGHSTFGDAIDLDSVHQDDWGQVPYGSPSDRRKAWWWWKWC